MDNVVLGDGYYMILRRIRHIKNLKNRYKMLNIFFHMFITYRLDMAERVIVIIGDRKSVV